MAYEKVKAIKKGFSLNYKGVHNFAVLYKMMHDWFMMRNYKSATFGDGEKIEDYYHEMIIPGTDMKNGWIYWRAAKIPSGDEMFRYVITIDIQILTMKNTEIMYEGQKVKTQSGEITIMLNGYVEVDPKKHWSDNWFSERIYPYVYRRYYKSLIDERKDELFDHCYDLWDRIKHYLGLLTVNKVEPMFHPEHGHVQMD